MNSQSVSNNDKTSRKDKAEPAAKARPGPSQLQTLLSDARKILWDSDRRAETADLLKQIEQLLAQKHAAQVRAKLNALKTLAQWRLTGKITPNYQNVNEARIQYSQIERFCPVFLFQKQFLELICEDYPKAHGPNEISSLYKTIDGVMLTPLIDPEEGIVVIRRPGATRTLIMFSSMAHLVSNVSACLLDRAIAQPLNANVIACFDTAKLFFLGGIKQIGDRQETIAHLQALVMEFRDTKITAIGGSSGVYGALHASCDLGIRHVVACSGPTSFDLGLEADIRPIYKKISAAAEAGEVELIDLVAKVSASEIKRVDFFVGKRKEFDMSQMNILRNSSDIVVPHLYDSDEHNIIVPAILDGSFMKAVTAPLTRAKRAVGDLEYRAKIAKSVLVTLSDKIRQRLYRS